MFALGLSVLCLAATILDVRADCNPKNKCQRCDVNGTCITCRPGFGFQSRTGYCEPCGPDCVECSPIGGNCTKCAVGYGPDFMSGNASCAPCLQEHCESGCSIYGAGTCDKCDDGHGPVPSTINCTICTEHCVSCPTKTSECESCDFGYSVFDPGNKSCGACSKYCTQNGCFEKGPGACDKCDPGYVYFRNNFTCGECAANCTSCLVHGAGQCDNCTFGYGLTPTNTCEPCSAHCTEYGCNITGAKKCDLCDFGYGLLLNGSCDKCSDNCTIYGCNTTGAYNCTQCDPGFGLFPNGSCGACSKYCTKLGCSKAGAGYCEGCDPGYEFFRHNKTCGECAANCSSCPVNGAGHCDNCTLGYGLTSTNTCAPCAMNCTMFGCAFNGAAKCDECDLGFQLIPATNTCALSTTTRLPTTTPNPTATSTTVASTTAAAINPTTVPGSAGSTTRSGATDFPSSNYTTAPNNNGGGSGTSGVTSAKATVVSISSIDESGMTTKNLGSNSDFSVSGLPLNTASPPGSNFSLAGEIDWRILLTLLMLILGGIFITFVALLCWAARFYPAAYGDLRRYRRRIYLVKES